MKRWGLRATFLSSYTEFDARQNAWLTTCTPMFYDRVLCTVVSLSFNIRGDSKLSSWNNAESIWFIGVLLRIKLCPLSIFSALLSSPQFIQQGLIFFIQPVTQQWNSFRFHSGLNYNQFHSPSGLILKFKLPNKIFCCEFTLSETYDKINSELAQPYSISLILFGCLYPQKTKNFRWIQDFNSFR